jgi:hypothetical protein
MMDRFNLAHFLVLMFIWLLLAGCQVGGDVLQNQTTPIVHDATITPEESVLPNVSADMGGFHIRLVYSSSNKPVRGQNIYLAEMLPLDSGPEEAFVPSLDLNTAPRAESTNQGNVVISMIPPGKYALALLTPQGAILVTDAITNKEIIVEIVAGQVTDLGEHKVILDPNFLEPGS